MIGVQNNDIGPSSIEWLAPDGAPGPSQAARTRGRPDGSQTVYARKDVREHCHIVWSCIDCQSEKAVHLAFDHEKLMMVKPRVRARSWPSSAGRVQA
ncbi:hypothetical protein B5V02_29935 [Mesorhizobium kowhaii]|uniref:Uncharacterized protein n=1 Tax=Mesorhizobium kowhaii TaxID=1300272 RepID=A0A2W7DUA7_9HYPH|nr:hypothetical protein B5V02_29935 [Mesorhizobium kowhaii]